MLEVPVEYKTDLANKYLGNFVSCSKLDNHICLLEDPDIMIINKDKSAVLVHNNQPIGAIIRDAATKNVSKHFGVKIKVTLEAHYNLNRGLKHAFKGELSGHGPKKDPLTKYSNTYAYKQKALNPDTQKILDEDGDTLATWLYEYGKHYLKFTTSSYDEFKKKVQLEDNELVGAVRILC